MKEERNAIFTFERFLDKGDKKATLLCFRGVRTYAQLPAEYLRGKKYFFRGDLEGKSLGTIWLIGFNYCGSHLPYDGFSELHHNYIKQGDTIEGNTMTNLIAYFKECGEELGKINRRQAKENKDWMGQEDVVI